MNSSHIDSKGLLKSYFIGHGEDIGFLPRKEMFLKSLPKFVDQELAIKVYDKCKDIQQMRNEEVLGKIENDFDVPEVAGFLSSQNGVSGSLDASLDEVNLKKLLEQMNKSSKVLDLYEKLLENEIDAQLLDMNEKIGLFSDLRFGKPNGTKSFDETVKQVENFNLFLSLKDKNKSNS